MGLFGLFGKKNNEAKKSRIPVYEKKLIPKFHKDHEKLVAQVGLIQKEIEKEYPQADKLRKLLKSLRIQLLGHFMEEDIKLYWYLKDYYKDDTHSFAVVKEFESSIKDIQKEVMRFFDHYSAEDAIFSKEFEKQFSEIVEVLAARISSEEDNLYTLYQQ